VGGGAEQASGAVGRAGGGVERASAGGAGEQPDGVCN